MRSWEGLVATMGEGKGFLIAGVKKMIVGVGPRARKIIQPPANMRPMRGRGPVCVVNLMGGKTQHHDAS